VPASRATRPGRASRIEELFRPDWLVGLVDACQALARRLPACTLSAGRRLIEATLARFEPPQTTVEDAVLRGFRVQLVRRRGGAASMAVRRPAGPLVGAIDVDDTLLAASSPVVRRAADFIARSCDLRLTTAIVARECACHGRKLERLFRQELGTSVHAHITKARLRRVAQLLRDPEAKIGPLALDIGFRAKSSLYRAVRKLTGTTPAELRRRSR
jgi:transcriptional regulator GlxA family with amidase domain